MPKDYTVAQLKEMARKKKISGYSKLRKQELMNALGLSDRVRRKSPKQVRKSPRKPLSSKDSCPLGDLKKYVNRPSPPRPANDPGCRDQIRRGNDGLLYASVSNKNGVYRWVKF